MHAVYNPYQRCNTDAFYTADNAFFGATGGAQRAVLLLSSATRKTAFATAARLALRPEVELVGLTSPAHVAFCQSLGLYHRVLTYDQLDAVAADAACIYVDFAGNGDLRRRVHTRFTGRAYNCPIGGTHVENRGAAGTARDLPGPRATLFFAPTPAKKRSADWGPAEFGRRLAQDWHAFRSQVADVTPPWLVVQQHAGPAAVQQAYALVLAGKGDARLGHVLTFDKAG